jgi:hypothetical protein
MNSFVWAVVLRDGHRTLNLSLSPAHSSWDLLVTDDKKVGLSVGYESHVALRHPCQCLMCSKSFINA